jgi:hypothetical protein
MIKEMKTIRLPKLLTIGWSHILLECCQDAIRYRGHLTFDFKNVYWAAPFGLTVISVCLAKCLDQGKDVFYTPPQRKEFKDYLERIGFRYHFFKGQKIAQKETSVELKCLRGVDPGCSEAIVEMISGMNKPSLSEDAKYEMRTHINELMTNGFDHARSKVGCYVCAQWYPRTKNLRVSFSDGGIGILQSLKDSGKFPEIRNDEAAIKLAIKPGITTRKKQLGGFGLDYIRKYIRSNKGTLSILSGNAKINFYKNKIETKNEPIRFDGTVVDIKISPKSIFSSERGSKNDLF